MKLRWHALPALLLLTLSVACSTGQALISPDPTPEQTAAVRREALRALEGLRVGLTITRQLGADLPKLGLPQAEATQVDCAILRVVGTTSTPSLAVVQACGSSLVPAAMSPLTLAIDAVGTVSTCPGLQSTLSAASRAVLPLVDQLEKSTVQAAQVLGASLRLAFVVLGPGGVKC